MVKYKVKTVKRYIWLSLAGFLFALILNSSCSKSEISISTVELLDLGEKYLLEMNYEQAVVNFIKLIEVEPMNPRGYIGLAEAYVGLGRDGEAVDVLQHGLAKLPNNSEIMSMLQSLSLTTDTASDKSDYIDEIGIRIVTLGRTDGNGNKTGFWIENHFDSETGSLIFLREGNYIEGKLSGDDKCIWIDEVVAAKHDGTGYGFGVGTYANDKRNGYQTIECFIGIALNAAADSEFIRFDDCVGVDLVYVYKGNMVDEILEDTSGTAYQMWMDDERVEYIGEFHGGTRNGFGRMWSSDWEFSGQFIDGVPSEDR